MLLTNWNTRCAKRGYSSGLSISHTSVLMLSFRRHLNTPSGDDNDTCRAIGDLLDNSATTASPSPPQNGTSIRCRGQQRRPPMPLAWHCRKSCANARLTAAAGLGRAFRRRLVELRCCLQSKSSRDTPRASRPSGKRCRWPCLCWLRFRFLGRPSPWKNPT